MDFGSILSDILTLVGVLGGSYIINSRTQALLEYRLTALENKVDKHNHVIERTYELEKMQAVAQEQFANMEESINDLNRRIEQK